MPDPVVTINLDNVQGLVAHTYACNLSRHLLFRFEAAAGARRFLAALLPVTTSADCVGSAPDQARNVGLSYRGLAATGALSAAALAQFAPHFISGPTPSDLHDAGPSGHWWNGVPGADLHCVVSLYSRADADLEAASDRVLAAAADTGTTHLIVRPDNATIDGRALAPPRRLHFGYLDGFSVPQMSRADPAQDPDVDFRHFLLGYSTPAIPSFPRAGDQAATEAADFARDGSYAALRLMHQNVAAFNRFLKDNAARLAPVLGMSQAEAAEWLAAKMLGRWPDGRPLAPGKDGGAAQPEDDFDYKEDRDGWHCPHAAHIRVAHPRRDQAMDPVHLPVPRLIRRGMPYGPELTGTDDDGKERGLIGLFFCADLGQQFVKVLDWINQTNFSPVFTDLRGQDPLLGNRSKSLASTTFVIPTPQGPLECTGLTTFVETRGTAYFLYPGVAALRRLAGVS